MPATFGFAAQGTPHQTRASFFYFYLFLLFFSGCVSLLFSLNSQDFAAVKVVFLWRQLKVLSIFATRRQRLWRLFTFSWKTLSSLGSDFRHDCHATLISVSLLDLYRYYDYYFALSCVLFGFFVVSVFVLVPVLAVSRRVLT